MFRFGNDNISTSLAQIVCICCLPCYYDKIKCLTQRLKGGKIHFAYNFGCFCQWQLGLCTWTLLGICTRVVLHLMLNEKQRQKKGLGTKSYPQLHTLARPTLETFYYIPKQCHKLMTKCWTHEAVRDILFSNHNRAPKKQQSF